MRTRVLEPESARAALSEFLSFAAFDLDVSILLIDGAAPLAVREAVDSGLSGMVDAFKIYGIHEVWVEEESLGALESIRPDVRVLKRSEIPALLRRYPRVMSL